MTDQIPPADLSAIIATIAAAAENEGPGSWGGAILSRHVAHFAERAYQRFGPNATAAELKPFAIEDRGQHPDAHDPAAGRYPAGRISSWTASQKNANAADLDARVPKPVAKPQAKLICPPEVKKAGPTAMLEWINRQTNPRGSI